jgi:hypothetical protein
LLVSPFNGSNRHATKSGAGQGKHFEPKNNAFPYVQDNVSPSWPQIVAFFVTQAAPIGHFPFDGSRDRIKEHEAKRCPTSWLGNLTFSLDKEAVAVNRSPT